MLFTYFMSCEKRTEEVTLSKKPPVDAQHVLKEERMVVILDRRHRFNELSIVQAFGEAHWEIAFILVTCILQTLEKAIGPAEEIKVKSW